MTTRSKWISPTIAASCLFLGGIIFGIAVPSQIPESILLLVLNTISAFGTLLLGIAAALGVYQWTYQQRQLKQSHRAENALEMLPHVQSNIFRFKGHFQRVKQYPMNLTHSEKERWKNIVKARFKDMSELIVIIERDLLAAEAHLTWFADRTFERDMSATLNSLIGLHFAIEGMGLDTVIDDLNFELPENQELVTSLLAETAYHLTMLEGSFQACREYLMKIANLY